MICGNEQPLLNVRAIAHHLKREPAFPPIIECGPKTINMWMKVILPDVAPAQISRRDGEVLNLLRDSSQPPITKEQSLAHHAVHGGQNLIAPILHLPVPTFLSNFGLQSDHGHAQVRSVPDESWMFRPSATDRARKLQIARRLHVEEYDKDEKKKAKKVRKREKAERKKAKEERKQARADRKKARGERKAEETRAKEERKRANKQKKEVSKAEKETNLEEAKKEMPAKKVVVQMSAEERDALLDELNSPPADTPPPSQSPPWEGFSDSEDDDIQFPFKGPLAYIRSTTPTSPLKHKSASAVQQKSKRKVSAPLDSDKEEGPVKKKVEHCGLF